MANHSFLRQLGIFTIPAFLSPEECEAWRRTAIATGGGEARVYREQKDRIADDFRKTLDVFVEDPIRLAAEARITALRADMERHFQMELGDVEPLRCLVYRTGDFFRLHKDVVEPDNLEAASQFECLRRRAIAVVTFLNAPDDEAEPYEGGVLSLYGLMGGVAGNSFGFPVDAGPGLLVAFPATTLHEVSPVLSGKRYTLVTWFWTKGTGEYGDGNYNPIET